MTLVFSSFAQPALAFPVVKTAAAGALGVGAAALGASAYADYKAEKEQKAQEEAELEGQARYSDELDTCGTSGTPSRGEGSAPGAPWPAPGTPDSAPGAAPGDCGDGCGGTRTDELPPEASTQAAAMARAAASTADPVDAALVTALSTDDSFPLAALRYLQAHDASVERGPCGGGTMSDDIALIHVLATFPLHGVLGASYGPIYSKAQVADPIAIHLALFHLQKILAQQAGSEGRLAAASALAFKAHDTQALVIEQLGVAASDAMQLGLRTLFALDSASAQTHLERAHALVALRTTLATR